MKSLFLGIFASLVLASHPTFAGVDVIQRLNDGGSGKATGDLSALLSKAIGASNYVSLATRFGWTLTPQDFGPVNGAGDVESSPANTVAFQAAFNASCSTPVFIPSGTYALGNLSVSCAHAKIRGASAGLTVLKPTTATGDFLTVGSQTAVLGAIEISDLSIIPPRGARTSGANMSVVGTNGTHLHDVVLYYGHNCLSVSNGSGSSLYALYLDHVNVSACQNNGVVFGQNDAGSPAADIFLSHMQINGNGANGLALYNVTGLHLLHIDVTASGQNNMAIIPGTGQIASVLRSEDLELDTSAHANLYVAPTGTGYVATLDFINLWVASAGWNTSFTTDLAPSAGVLIQGASTSISGINFNLRAVNNSGHGVDIRGGSHISVTGQVNVNGTYANSKYCGLHVAAGVSDWAFDGNAGQGSGPTVPNKQSYGVCIDAGASANYSVKGDLSGNVIGPLIDGGTGKKDIQVINGPHNIISNYAFNIGSDFFDENLWDYRLNVTGTSAKASDEAPAGQAMVRFTTGTGALTSESLLFGLYDEHYAWIQASKPGTAVRFLALNPLGGNVGVGTTSPQAALDVNGFARLTLQSSAPAICSAANAGAIALTHTAKGCSCNGRSWVLISDGATACSW